ncbi:hypothetical protein DFH01_12610 [Falsiroseomonas bella]|uniref:Uncharacterized protein n=1 Tax=Falsiroseomonas bella TaxID=2184016 RepID=A0A317FH11_9PROT|nr:hypothetical protein [Falsiroseomonas bella]PWS37652.1 hypothetical protein DFH01_12610 [Falsiroseomonas bella]
MATRGLPAWPYTTTDPEDLPAAERLLLDSARAWAAARNQGIATVPAMRRILATESAEGAAPAMDALLRNLTSAGPLTLGCPLCPRLVGEEPPLLLFAALVQRGPRREAFACLLNRMPGRPGYDAMAAAIHLGAAFRRAGLLFADPWRLGSPARRDG